MKNISLLLALTVVFSLVTGVSAAGILIKKQRPVHNAPCTASPNQSVLQPECQFVSPIEGEQEHPPSKRKKDKGLMGILSFCSSVAGISLILIFASVGVANSLPLMFITAGIALGVMGTHKRRKIKGLAIAGLALSVLTAAMYVIAAIIPYK